MRVLSACSTLDSPTLPPLHTPPPHAHSGTRGFGTNLELSQGWASGPDLHSSYELPAQDQSREEAAQARTSLGWS